MHLQCPHCRNPVDVVDSDRPGELMCPSCGCSFRLDTDRTRQESTVAYQQKLGRFTLVDKVGVGAFGAVYKAKDSQLERTVAIKVPRAANLPDGQYHERFLREARSAAQLRHPAIVSVHEVGEEDGVPFIVSDFVEGVTLADLLTARRPTFRETGELIARVADALQYAHTMGVIHRDVKPSNVMLESGVRNQECGVGNERSPLTPDTCLLTPRLMDFGLAKRDAGEITVTLDGQVLGTPAYMSPEQARGEGHEVDGRSDVYSLGVILFELLTGELPFRGNTRMMLHQVLHDDPRPPRTLNDRIPRDLETICLKAMAKEPGRRYHRAGDMADDLRRWLQGEPIAARPVGAVARALRWTGRRPALAALIAVSGLSVLGLLLGSLIYSADLGAALETTKKREEEANRERQQAVTHLYHSLVGEAQALRRARGEGYRALAWKRLDQALHLDTPEKDPARLRQEAVACLGDFVGLEPTVWSDFGQEMHAVAVDSAGNRVALGRADGAIALRDRITGMETAVLRGHRGAVTALHFTRSARLLSGSTDRSIKIWEATAGQEWTCVRTIGTGSPGIASITAEGRLAAIGGNTVTLWNLDDGSRAGAFAVPRDEQVRDVRLSPDGALVAAAYAGKLPYEGGVIVWDVATGEQKWLVKPQLMMVFNAAARERLNRHENGTHSGWEASGRQWEDGHYLGHGEANPAPDPARGTQPGLDNGLEPRRP